MSAVPASVSALSAVDGWRELTFAEVPEGERPVLSGLFDVPPVRFRDEPALAELYRVDYDERGDGRFTAQTEMPGDVVARQVLSSLAGRDGWIRHTARERAGEIRMSPVGGTSVLRFVPLGALSLGSDLGALMVELLDQVGPRWEPHVRDGWHMKEYRPGRYLVEWMPAVRAAGEQGHRQQREMTEELAGVLERAGMWVTLPDGLTFMSVTRTPKLLRVGEPRYVVADLPLTPGRLMVHDRRTDALLVGGEDRSELEARAKQANERERRRLADGFPAL